ncbi:hypothetical protein PR202_gb26182 [Eleusine coracana subsp. coracana]|uniref:AB hydrolase-1 domain-containing protein n=1 Tax=Eleusine coracana subsp. coracana TaxID=191504 RepID=A0AAV5FR71_ELECO|nr:hypothetical protein PR202_gb26154 [Eleusine coracana subsp. coracana]GJN37250.1 hypothetical protein PR202_gb26182 [Eleusine coracana subsp. coracana]
MSAVLAHDYAQCMEEQMRLIYDPSIDDYRNLPGVEIRVPEFGSARGFHDKNPLTPYPRWRTLFGAPYDWRHASPLPGQASRAYTHFFKKLKALVEAASNKQGKKDILFGHSYGGMAVLEFVRNTPMAWRKKYIKHLFFGGAYAVARVRAATTRPHLSVGKDDDATAEFQHDNFEESPKLVYGDGDEVVNLISMLAFEEEMCRQPEQRKQFKSIKVHKTRHTELVTAEWAVNRVLPEIIAANRIF